MSWSERGTEEGQGSPVTVPRKAAQPLALGSPAAQRGHVGLPEHQAVWIEAILQAAPALPPPRDVGAALLKGEQFFFEAETFASQEGPYRVVRDFHASRGKFVLQPVQR